MSSISNFLESLHNSLKSARSSDAVICVVVGNQACDLDSVVGALVHAHLNVDHGIVLPLIQCKRDEFRLRSDTHAALRRIGVELGVRPTRAALFCTTTFHSVI
jgi:hypothetical protein